MPAKLGLHHKQVIAAYERHQTMCGAAAELGCTQQNVGAHLRRVGYARRFKAVTRPTSWSDAEISMVKHHYKKDLSASKIAAILGRSRNEVIGKAYRMGL